MASLRTQQVVKRFGENTILKGIDLDIQDGEFIILVGPSGCGKSTLMNTIAGLEQVSDGEIFIDESPITGLAPKARDIAMVFQSYALYPTMRVRDNISFALEMQKVPKEEREQVVDRVAKMLQIEHLLDRKPSQLSGGQRQRVAIGRALAREPKLYLFDEPLSNLDAKLRVEMRVELKKLHKKLGTTIVYVTHDQIEAMTLGDRIAVMKDGEVLQFDSPQQIYDNPVNMFVAGFIGSPAMNFIQAEVCATEWGIGVHLQSDCDEQILPVPDTEKAKALRSWIGKKVCLGLRPEQIHEKVPHLVEQDGICHMKAHVDVIEPTGADTLVLVKINGDEVGCRMQSAFTPQLGSSVELQIDMNKAIFFDPQTEERVA